MKIKLLPLLNLAQHGAVCSILKIDKLRIMLDCGINEKYDYSVYQKYQKKIKKLNIILLSHAETQYHGALPYLFNELECQAEIYSTLPVSDLSLVNMFDFILNRFHQSLHRDQGFYQKLYKNIADLYDKINKVKFQQHIVLYIQGKEISIKPYHIGHTVGACAWCISNERRNILYLVTYNHIDERILNGMNFSGFDEKTFDLLITNSNNISHGYKKIKDKETELKSYIEYSSKNHSNVVLTCSSTSRMYELLLFVLNIWSNKGPWNGPVYLYHNFMGLLQLAHSQLEFMSDAMTDDFYSNGDNPFRQFVEQNRHEEKLFNAEVKLCRSPDDVDLKAVGKLIITNMSNLFFGSGGELLNSIWNNPKDLLIMTERVDFYQNFLENLKNQRNLSAKSDIFDETFFANLPNKETNEKKTQDPTDTASLIADQETVITEEEFQPTSKPAIQSSLFGTKSFPAFAFIESKPKGNEFGEFIPESQVEVFKIHSAKIDPFPKENNVNSSKGPATFKAKFEPYFFENEVIVIPQPNVLNSSPKMRVIDIDLNGVSDGESMIKIINAINPKVLMLVNGSQEDSNIIKEKLIATRGEENLYFANPEEKQEIELVSNTVGIKINPEYFGHFSFNTICTKNLDLMMTRIRGHEITVKPLKEKKDVEVELAPLSLFSGESEGDKNFEAFGQVDLEKFRQVLEENEYGTYYKDGVLCVENIFFVRKEKGKIVIEGRFCKEYLEIRNLLYSFTSL